MHVGIAHDTWHAVYLLQTASTDVISGVFLAKYFYGLKVFEWLNASCPRTLTWLNTRQPFGLGFQVLELYMVQFLAAPGYYKLFWKTSFPGLF